MLWFLKFVVDWRKSSFMSFYALLKRLFQLKFIPLMISTDILACWSWFDWSNLLFQRSDWQRLQQQWCLDVLSFARGAPGQPLKGQGWFFPFPIQLQPCELLSVILCWFTKTQRARFLSLSLVHFFIIVLLNLILSGNATASPSNLGSMWTAGAKSTNSKWREFEHYIDLYCIFQHLRFQLSHERAGPNGLAFSWNIQYNFKLTATCSKIYFRWSESRCLLSHERSSPGGQAQIVPNPPTEYFSRVCLNSEFLWSISLSLLIPFLYLQKITWLPSVETRPTVSQCGRTPPLTRQIAKQSVAFFFYFYCTFSRAFQPCCQQHIYPNSKVTANSREGCMDLCLEETAFICRAAVYTTRSGACSLTRCKHFFVLFLGLRQVQSHFCPGSQKHKALRRRALWAVEMAVTTWRTTVFMVSQHQRHPHQHHDYHHCDQNMRFKAGRKVKHILTSISLVYLFFCISVFLYFKTYWPAGGGRGQNPENTAQGHSGQNAIRP